MSYLLPQAPLHAAYRNNSQLQPADKPALWQQHMHCPHHAHTSAQKVSDTLFCAVTPPLQPSSNARARRWRIWAVRDCFLHANDLRRHRFFKTMRHWEYH